MGSVPANSHVRRFGTYEFDLRTGELRKQGMRIRLEGQPVAILRMLLDRSGELVTREELQKELWPSNTFVDFEHSLNSAIKRLRQALSDSPDAPRYIETLAGRGYRFIAHVTGLQAAIDKAREVLGDDAENPRFVETLPPYGPRIVASVETVPTDLPPRPLTAKPRLEIQPSPPTSPSRAGQRRVLQWSMLSLALAAIVGGAVWFLKPSPSLGKPVVRAVITLPPGQHMTGLDYAAVALSAEGSELAYVAAQDGVQQIYVRAMDSGEVRPIPFTQGATSPFFSPDGNWLGFVSGGQLKKISVNGGSSQTLAAAQGIVGATWGERHTIVFAPIGSVLRQVSDEGGVSRAVSRFDAGESSQQWPAFLPGSDALVFLGLWPARIAVQSLRTGERRNLLTQELIAVMPRYVPSGHLVYSLGGNLMAVPLDTERLKLTGTAVPVVKGVIESRLGASQYSVSHTGTLVYVPGSLEVECRLVWVSRKGTEQALAAPGASYSLPQLSPDGRQIALGIVRRSTTQLWLYDLTRDSMSQLTSEGSLNTTAVWTPDSKRIAYASNKEGPFRVFWRPADGSSGPERLTTSDVNFEVPYSWSPDGKLLIFGELFPPANLKIRVLRLADDSAQPFLQAPAVEGALQFSPDGRWISYASNESGRREIYIRPYPGPGGKWQISTDGGTEPVWNRNGRELFYRIGDKVMAVEIHTQPTFFAGRPQQLFQGDYLSTEAGAARPNYDVSPDGQHFLMLKPVEQEAPTQINVVLNWTEELKRLVPPGK